MQSAAARQYLKTKVSTNSQGELLVMLYEGAINFLNQAKAKMAEGDMANKGILIGKALDIINELSSSLNKERGGEIADNLSNLYFYCNSRLLTANLRMDPAPIDEVITILSSLHDAYSQIVSEGADKTLDAPPMNMAPQSTPRMAPSAPANDIEGMAGPAPEIVKRRIVQAYGQPTS